MKYLKKKKKKQSFNYDNIFLKKHKTQTNLMLNNVPRRYSTTRSSIGNECSRFDKTERLCLSNNDVILNSSEFTPVSGVARVFF